MLDYTNFEYSSDKLPKDRAEQKLFFRDLRKKFINEIRNSALYHEYLQRYDPKSVENFVIDYAGLRVSLVKNYRGYERAMREAEEIRFKKEGEELLGYILQKKLFNLQVQWRAGQIDIKEIRNSYDFDFWEQNILYCPFIPPVTDAEVALMKKFLETRDFSDFDDVGVAWQNYDRMTERDEIGGFECMPDWYEQYDIFMGTSALLLLPDVRGPKEDFYIQIAMDAEEKEYKAQMALNPPEKHPDPLPNIYGYAKNILEFAEICETDPCFKELIRQWADGRIEKSTDIQFDKISLSMAVDTLEEADRELILPAGMDWQKAIMHCAERYITDGALKALDNVYEEYKMLRELGIYKQLSPEEIEKGYSETIVPYFCDLILKGRELCGEPRDFNIYG